jgi:hypothetical protein
VSTQKKKIKAKMASFTNGDLALPEKQIEKPPAYSLLSQLDLSTLEVKDWKFVGPLMTKYKPPSDNYVHYKAMMINDVCHLKLSNFNDIVGDANEVIEIRLMFRWRKDLSNELSPFWVNSKPPTLFSE